MGALLLAVALSVAACSSNSRVPLKQLPVQLGRAPPATPTPPPTATAVPPPQCNKPATQVSGLKQDKGPGPDTQVLAGEVKSNCAVAVDVTLYLRWLDGPESQAGPRAFAVLQRVQPGEVRQFSEEVVAARGATRADVSADVQTAAGRRR